MKSWAYCAVVVSMLAAAACGKSPATTGTTTGDTGGTGGAAMTTGSNTTGSNTTGSNTTGSNTTGSNTTGSNTTGSGTTGAGGGGTCGTQTLGSQACDDCAATNCCTEWAACDPGTECDTFLVCINKCTKGDMACQQACVTADQQGATDQNTLAMCVTNSCMMECNNGAICDSGLATPKKPECGTCLGTNCCTEFDACTADATCKACLLNPMAAGCTTNALAKSANDCANAKCAVACGP